MTPTEESDSSRSPRMTTEEEGFDMTSRTNSSGTAPSDPKSDGQSPSALADLLADLLARVQAAEGPDRELDAAIICGLYPACEQHTSGALATEGGCYWQPMSGGMTVRTAEPLTASLDAALALCERVLPGWRPTLKNVGMTKGHEWRVTLQCWRDTVSAWGRTASLALLTAMLRARIATGQAGTADRPTEPREDPDRPQPIKPKTHNHSGKGAEDVG